MRAFSRNPMKFRAALFDFDGTLAPSLPLWVSAYQLALRSFGIEASDEEVLASCFFRDYADVAAHYGRFDAEQLGAQTVVVHPPFRWQRRYAEGFSDQVAELEASSDVTVAVENMFPFRADRFFGAGQTSIERMRKRGGRPGPGISAFAPSYDPLDGNHAHYTLDLSHTATAGTDALDMVRRMGNGLTHLHLCDGSGASELSAATASGMNA